MTERQFELWRSLANSWLAYKRTAAWTPTQEQRHTVQLLAREVLNRNLGSCASCYIDAMRQLERIANG
jgi:hypothetical protein